MAAWIPVLLAGMLLCACQPSSRVELGEAQYEKYCAACHPVTGAAAAASAPGTPAPDLTRLWERYGSPLSRDELAAFIDGRREVEAHGPRNMPVWGVRLYEDYPQTSGTEAVRKGTVEILIDYLESVQRS